MPFKRSAAAVSLAAIGIYRLEHYFKVTPSPRGPIPQERRLTNNITLFIQNIFSKSPAAMKHGDNYFVKLFVLESHYGPRLKKLRGLTVLSIGAGVVAYGVIQIYPSLCIPMMPVLALAFMSATRSSTSYFNCAFGLKGERRVLRLLQDLPDAYIAIANWHSGIDGEGDVDLMVLGPHGVLVVEIKCWTSETVCEGDRWWIVYLNGYRKSVHSPTRQAKTCEKRIAKLLKGFDCQVRSVVVFNDRADLTLRDPAIRVLRFSELKPFLLSLPTGDFDPKWVLEKLFEGGPPLQSAA